MGLKTDSPPMKAGNMCKVYIGFRRGPDTTILLNLLTRVNMKEQSVVGSLFASCHEDSGERFKGFLKTSQQFCRHDLIGVTYCRVVMDGKPLGATAKRQRGVNSRTRGEQDVSAGHNSQSGKAKAGICLSPPISGRQGLRVMGANLFVLRGLGVSAPSEPYGDLG